MATAQLKPGLVSMSLTSATVNNAVKSYTMSKRYIYTMLKATVINIFYHRLDIDKKEFVTKTFNNVPFKAPAKCKSRNTYIRQFGEYMAACKDAIEKNYLRQFYLYFVDADTGDVLEYYKFGFKYANKDQTNPSQNEEDLTNLTSELLRTLQDLETHPKFDGRAIKIRGEFTYFADTPAEYEPPGFQAVDASNALFKKLNRDGNIVVLCSLYTGFHKMTCKAKGGIFQLNNDSEAANGSIMGGEMDLEYNNLEEINEEAKGTPLNDGAQFVPDSAAFTEDLSEPINREYNKSPASRMSKTKRQLNESFLTDVTDVISIVSTNDGYYGGTCCPCRLEKHDEFWSPDIIQCSKCSLTGHVACHGYLDKTFIGFSFVCSKCEPTPDDDLSDYSLFVKRCKLRYVLACVYKLSRIPTDLEQSEKKLLKILVENKAVVLTKDGNWKPKQAALQKFFRFVFKKPDMEKIL